MLFTNEQCDGAGAASFSLLDRSKSRIKMYTFFNHIIFPPEPIVLVILKSACFLNHALLPRDFYLAGSEKRDVGRFY
jgi:hypothetical protein